MVQKAQEKKQSKALLPRVIAISSGKGGVGKSSITVNLGISLARQGAKVCVLDADTGLANANILLGITPQFSLEHVLYGAKSIEEVMLDGPHGMKIIPGAHGISECVSLHPRQQLRLTRELARVENDFDFLLVDTAAGISATTLDFISAAQHALIVITPEPTSLTDAFSLIKLLKRRTSRLHYHVVVNMCSGASQAKEVFHRFCSAIEKYIGIEAHYLGFVLRDESMRAAVVLQNPVAMFPDEDPSCRAFLRLAETLDSATSALTSHSSFSAYWHRQFRRQRQGIEEPQVAEVESVNETTQVSSMESREANYLSEIRSRLLLLIEQGSVDKELLKKLLQESVDVFIKRYSVSPVDPVKLIESLVHSPERDDVLLRDIHERVKHWGGGNNVPSVDELMGDSKQQYIPVNNSFRNTAIAPSDSAVPSDSTAPCESPVSSDSTAPCESPASSDSTVPCDSAVSSGSTVPPEDIPSKGIAPCEDTVSSQHSLSPERIVLPENHRACQLLTDDHSDNVRVAGLVRETPPGARQGQYIPGDRSRHDADVNREFVPALMTREKQIKERDDDRYLTHCYDVQRFGSQEGFLDILRRGATDKSLSELLEAWL